MTPPSTFLKLTANKQYLENKQADAIFCLNKFKLWVHEIKHNLETIVLNGYFIENNHVYTIKIKASKDRKYIGKDQIFFIKF